MAKNKIGKHLQFYMDCMKRGSMPCAGLCGCADDKDISEKMFLLMEPTVEDYIRLNNRNMNTVWWASGIRNRGKDRISTFTPLRQTIVLFMAALNNEL